MPPRTRLAAGGFYDVRLDTRRARQSSSERPASSAAYWQAPIPSIGHPHVPDALQHPAVIRTLHLGHADATHPDPLDDAEDPDELELLAETQVPALQIALTAVQSTQAAPPVPQFAVSEPAWHVAVLSQHPPGQEVLSHDPLLLPPEMQAPPWQVAPPAHRITFCQLPVGSQVWASLPLHRAEPGAQPPVHAPP